MARLLGTGESWIACLDFWVLCDNSVFFIAFISVITEKPVLSVFCYDVTLPLLGTNVAYCVYLVYLLACDNCSTSYSIVCKLIQTQNCIALNCY